MSSACQPTQPTYPALRLQLQHPDAVMRQHAVDAFVLKKEKAVLPLLMALAGKSAVAKVAAKQAFRKLGKDAVPSLSWALRQRRWRPFAADALRQVGKPAVVALRSMTKAPEAILRWQAFSLLAELSLSSDEGRALAVQGLRDPHEGVRSAACLVLERMGHAAEAALPALLEALQQKSQSLSVKLRLLLVLEQFRPQLLKPHRALFLAMYKGAKRTSLRVSLHRVIRGFAPDALPTTSAPRAVQPASRPTSRSVQGADKKR
ncbi:MAG: HEAT repeat domain-containing protein [Myxococcales bacterium]|nr:HEAT repeat domain-containing protein [Myxococcales bacterium]MCB9644093.1 HEAT repeat domain-containing protein [Myxococcales bacterium]